MKTAIENSIIALGVIIAIILILAPSSVSAQKQVDIKSVSHQGEKGFGPLDKMVFAQEPFWVGVSMKSIYIDQSRFNNVANFQVFQNIAKTSGVGLGLDKKNVYLFLNSTYLVETVDGTVFFSCLSMLFDKTAKVWTTEYRPIYIQSQFSNAGLSINSRRALSKNQTDYSLKFKENEYIVLSL